MTAQQVAALKGDHPAAAAAQVASADDFVPGGRSRASSIRYNMQSREAGGRGPGWSYGSGGWTYRTPGSTGGIQSGALADISPASPEDVMRRGLNLTGNQGAGRNLSRPVESEPIGPVSTDPTAHAGHNWATDPTAHAGHNLAALDYYRRLRAEHDATVRHIQRNPLKLHYTAPSPDEHSQRARHASEATARRQRDQRTQN